MEPANNKSNLVIVSKRETGVAVIELNRARKRNALSQELIDELNGVLRKLDRDADVRVMVLTSSGDAPFCGRSSCHARLRSSRKLTSSHSRCRYPRTSKHFHCRSASHWLAKRSRRQLYSIAQADHSSSARVCCEYPQQFFNERRFGDAHPNDKG
jgi:hypothetical protein